MGHLWGSDSGHNLQTWGWIKDDLLVVPKIKTNVPLRWGFKRHANVTSEELYLRLGTLVEEMPDLATEPITKDVNKWLGRAVALIGMTGDTANTITLTVASQNLNTSNREQTAQTIKAVVYTALAKVELDAPAQIQGTFIAAGHTFDAFAAVSKVVRTATTNILLVDPYADERVVIDYVGLAPEKV